MDSITQLRIAVKVGKHTIDIMVERPYAASTWMGIWLIREWTHNGKVATERRLVPRTDFENNELPYDNLSEHLKELLWSGLLQVDELQ